MSPAQPSMAVSRYSWLPKAHFTSFSLGSSTYAGSARKGLIVTTPPSARRAVTSAATSAARAPARSAGTVHPLLEYCGQLRQDDGLPSLGLYLLHHLGAIALGHLVRP